MGERERSEEGGSGSAERVGWRGGERARFPEEDA